MLEVNIRGLCGGGQTVLEVNTRMPNVGPKGFGISMADTPEGVVVTKTRVGSPSEKSLGATAALYVVMYIRDLILAHNTHGLLLFASCVWSAFRMHPDVHFVAM